MECLMKEILLQVQLVSSPVWNHITFLEIQVMNVDWMDAGVVLGIVVSCTSLMQNILVSMV